MFNVVLILALNWTFRHPKEWNWLELWKSSPVSEVRVWVIIFKYCIWFFILILLRLQSFHSWNGRNELGLEDYQHSAQTFLGRWFWILPRIFYLVQIRILPSERTEHWLDLRNITYENRDIFEVLTLKVVLICQFQPLWSKHYSWSGKNLLGKVVQNIEIICLFYLVNLNRIQSKNFCKQPKVHN